MKTELLEALVRKCVCEVLDQVQEEANASKLKSSGIGKGDDKKPAKQKTGVPVNFKKSKGFKVNVKKLNEEEEKPDDKQPEDKPEEPSPETGHKPEAPSASTPPAPTPGKPPAEPSAPAAAAPVEKPHRVPKGASVINPKDKSRLDPIKWMGRDESSIERTLHQVAVSTSGPRTKVSLGAKRMAREAATNPNINVFFYIGKMDPESDEVFLMADKSLQLAKDGSVHPGELIGSPTAMQPNKALNYTSMTTADYEDHMNRRNLPAPRYGVDEPEPTGEPEAIGEGAAKLIKKMVNQILDS